MMTPMTRRMFAALLILLPHLRAKNRKSDIRSTGAYKAAMSLRRNLEEMGLYDDMLENWQEVEKAIAEGCTNFTTGVSRIIITRSDDGFDDVMGSVIYRVLPIKAPPNEHGWFEKWPTRR